MIEINQGNQVVLIAPDLYGRSKNPRPQPRGREAWQRKRVGSIQHAMTWVKRLMVGRLAPHQPY